jgi:hypothetical protein
MSPDEKPERIIGVANELRPRFVFLEKGEIGAAAEGVLDSLQHLGSVNRIIVFPDTGVPDDRVLNFKAVLKFGLMKRKKLEDELAGIYKNISPEHPAALFLRPGTDNARTVEVSEGDLMESLRNVSHRCPRLDAEDQSFSYMREASPFAKFVNYLTLYQGGRAAVAEGRKDFYQDIVEVMPTVLFETKAGLEEICGKSLRGLNGRQPGKKLMADLGNRVKLILTDSIPGGETGMLLRSTGASLVEITEFNDLLG